MGILTNTNEAHTPERLLEATDLDIEEAAMWTFSGYCLRMAAMPAIKAETKQQWKKLANKVQAICELRYKRVGDKLIEPKETRNTVINDKAKSTNGG